MRALSRLSAIELYQKAQQLYQVRLLVILILIPLYVLTSRWVNLQVPFWPLCLVALIEVFLNYPYKFMYVDSRAAFRAIVASIMLDFLAETTVLHLVGNVDVFIYIACYFISIVYCALNLPKPLTLEFATLASVLYANLIILGRLGIIPPTVSFGENLTLNQEIAIVLRHIAFFYLIAIFVRFSAESMMKKEERLENLVGKLKKMRHSYFLQTDYFARMSHEIRSPLNSILGFSQLLLENTIDALTEKQRDFLSRIQRSGKHLRDLINDVLDISKIDAKKMKAVFQKVDLVRVMETTFDLFYEETLQKKIAFGFTKKPSEPFFISCDELKIRQVLYNLLSNAIKFTPVSGSITMSLTKNPGYAKIAVEDSGPGIPPQYREIIFLPYEQAGRTISKGLKGTGLGLAISKEFVEMHSGMLWVESELGKGSRFVVQLPEHPPLPKPAENNVA